MEATADRESEGFFSGLLTKYDEIWKTFVLPPRAKYETVDMGDSFRRVDMDTHFQREDRHCHNVRGEKLEFSFFQLDGGVNCTKSTQQSCVVYLHSHAGSRMEGLGLLKAAARLGKNFCCFDFAGSGLSEGKYTTLGLRESEDCRSVLLALQYQFRQNNFILWGRSMGAVAAILYASTKPQNIEFLVLDSPFSSVETMVRDAGNSMVTLGEYLAMGVFKLIRSDIEKAIGFDVADLKPIDHCSKCDIPCAFVVGCDDKLVKPDRVESMCNLWSSSFKSVIEVEGSHSSGREPQDLEKVIKFISQVLEDKKKEDSHKTQHLEATTIVESQASIKSYLRRGPINSNMNNLNETLVKSEQPQHRVMRITTMRDDRSNKTDHPFGIFFGKENQEPSRHHDDSRSDRHGPHMISQQLLLKRVLANEASRKKTHTDFNNTTTNPLMTSTFDRSLTLEKDWSQKASLQKPNANKSTNFITPESFQRLEGLLKGPRSTVHQLIENKAVCQTTDFSQNPRNRVSLTPAFGLKQHSRDQRPREVLRPSPNQTPVSLQSSFLRQSPISTVYGQFQETQIAPGHPH